MLRHYATYTFRKWWPLLLVASILFAVTLSYSGLGLSTTYEGYLMNSNEQGVYMTYAIVSLVIGLGFCFVFPMFINSYRTKKRSVDTYYQAGIDSRMIRRIHILIAMAMLLIAYTGGFIIGAVVYLLRFLATPEVAQGVPGRYNGDGNIYRLNINFGFFFIVYLIVLVILLGQFFINTFLASLGNYVFDQICLMIFGNIFLALLFIAPYLYLMSLTRTTGSYIAYGLNYSLSNVGLISLLIGIIIPSFANGQEFEMAYIVNVGLGAFLSLASGAGCCLGSMFLKDPSGEYANSRKPIHPAIHLIPHGAAICIGFLFTVVGSVNTLSNYTFILAIVVLPFFLYILYAVAYFMILALWRHSFRMSKVDLICYLSVAGSILLLLIAQMIGYGI